MSEFINRLNRWMGHCTAIAVILMTLVAVITALLRRVGIGSNGLLEIQWYFFSFIFLIAAAEVLRQDEHVRVNVLSQRFSPKTRHWIDLIGHSIVLVPLCVLMLATGIQDTYQNFKSAEMSADSGGLIRWPVKAIIPLAFFLLLLQTLQQAYQAWHSIHTSQSSNTNSEQ